MKIGSYFASGLAVFAVAEGLWFWWGQPRTRDTSESVIPQVPTTIGAHGKSEIDELIAARSRFSESDWDRRMIKILGSDDVPFADKEWAYGEMSRMAQLLNVPWFFRIYSEHKTIDECLEFCAELPFVSHQQQSVTDCLVKRILEECDLETAVGHIRKMDIGVSYAISRMVDQELPESFDLADVEVLRKRLPEDWRLRMLSTAASSHKSALGYDDMKVLFGASDDPNYLGNAVMTLACRGKLCHSELLDVMRASSIPENAKPDIIQNGASHITPPDVATFGKLFGTGLPPDLVDKFVRAVAGPIELANPGAATDYGRSIPDPELRKYFFRCTAVQWTLTNQTVDECPYWDELGSSERSAVRGLLDLKMGKSK